MTGPRVLRCAVYTRKSTEEGLAQDFNSLQAQREACEAFIRSQRSEGWTLIPAAYDDGGISGGTMERPALQRLFAHIEEKRVDVVVVYKVDRLTRSLADFSKMVELFDRYGVSFIEPPAWHAPRQCHRFVFGLTTSEGVLSSWNGQRPIRSLPCAFNTTPADSTRRSSETCSFSRSISESAMRAIGVSS